MSIMENCIPKVYFTKTQKSSLATKELKTSNAKAEHFIQKSKVIRVSCATEKIQANAK